MEKAIEVSLKLRDNMYDKDAWQSCISNNGMAPVYPPPKQTTEAIGKLQQIKDGSDEINWGMFDKIFCFHYVNDVKRYAPLKSELSRVGIWGRENFELVETVRTTYEEKALSGCSKGELNLAINSLRCLERAKAHGYRRVLFLEDDIRFLKEKRWIRRIIENSPETDIVMYDKMNFIFPPEFDGLCDENKINDFFAKWDYGLYATSCYSVNRAAIEKLIAAYNERLCPIDHYIQLEGYTKSFAYVNVCCQEADDESMLYDRISVKSYGQKNGYAFDGLNYAYYNVDDGYGYASIESVAYKTITMRHALGRMSNQMYYVLQAFVRGKRRGERIKFKVEGTSLKVNFDKYIDKLNIREYTEVSSACADEVMSDDYYQVFGKDFDRDELYEFIRRTILGGEVKKPDGLDEEHTVLITLRNTDYLDTRYEYYDRKDYLIKAASRLPKEIKTCHVSSDDIEYSKKEFGELLATLFENVEYLPTGDAAEDQARNSYYKYMILSASSYSWWGAFVSNVRYSNNHSNIIVPWCHVISEFNPDVPDRRYDPLWIKVPVLTKWIVQNERNIINAFSLCMKGRDAIEAVSGDRFEEIAKENNCDFCKTDDYLQGAFYPKSKILITHNSDKSVTREDYAKWKSREGHGIWFAQNAEVAGADIVPIPIGIENWRWSFTNKEPILDRYRMLHVHPKKLAMCNFSLWTNRVKRQECLDYFKDKWYVTNYSINALTRCDNLTEIEYSQMCRNIKDHVFNICPVGNGIDTLRLWETLILGRIPVVLRTDYINEFSDMPILILDRWDEFQKKASEMMYVLKEKDWSLKKLTTNYWRQRIKSAKEEV